MNRSLTFAASYAFILWMIVSTAGAHEATSTAGQPLGWAWAPECCGGTDCAIIPSSAVVEGPDGYRVTLKAGEHPMLSTKGYSAVIPYGSERTSPTGEYGICLGVEGAHRFCFYAGGKGY
ncbi:MAG: hypothetical protein PS018_03295 [bacterium]|nr:hypothetical protein [bacterium]